LSFRNNADLSASSVPMTHDAIIMLGYTVAYDMPPVVYRRWLDAGQPPHPGKLEDGDKNWWELAPEVGYVDIRWLGAKLDSTLPADLLTNNGALLNAIKCVSPFAVNNFEGFNFRKVFLPEGNLFISEVNILVRGVTIEGSITDSSIIRCQVGAGAALFVFDGGNGISGLSDAISGGGLRRLTILNGTGFEGDRAVSLIGGPKRQAYETVFEDLKISGVGPTPPSTTPVGKWKYAMYLDGSGGTVTPKGLRKVSLRNLFLGNPTVKGLEANSVGDLVVENAGVYGGTDTSNSFSFLGSEANPSNGVQIIAGDADVFLWVYYCDGFNYSGIAKEIRFSTNAKGCAFFGVQLPGGITFPVPPLTGGNIVNAATW
jgi:hypothetical protein